MSNNIWGYQGLQTPLENLTKGDYNVADYTNMRKEFNARLQALENAGGFIPTNVSIQGYCSIVPGTGGFGNFSASGNSILTGTLTVGQNATFSSNLSVGGNITSVSGQFIGNGAGLTGIVATDSTKLPLAGGTMTGSLSTQAVSVINGYNVFNYKGNKFTVFANTNAGPFTVLQQNSSVHDYIKLTGNVSCTVSLTNLVTTNNQYYQDQQRLATITKRNMVNGDYTVIVLPPLNYVFNSKVAVNASSYSIPLGVFSVTFMINSVSSSLAYEIDVISIVNI